MNQTVEIGLGYLRIINILRDSKFNEDTICEQATLTHVSGRSTFKHRLRLEQRFIQQRKLLEDGGYLNDGVNYNGRARYKIARALPLI